MYPPAGRASGTPDTVTPGEPQSVAVFLFGVIARRRTWLNSAYLWLAFPLGLFYFVFLVTGLSVGIGLSITLVGFPILLLMVAAWWVLAAVERATARTLLGVRIAPAPRPWQKAEGWLARIRAHLSAGATWRDLAFLLLKLPMGVASFVLCVTGLAIVVSLIGAPVLQQFDAITIAGERIDIDSWILAAIFVPIGILALFVWLHVLNGFAWLSARLAEGLLGSGERTPEVGAAAGPAVAPMAPYAPPQAWAYPQPQAWVYTPPQAPPEIAGEEPVRQ